MNTSELLNKWKQEEEKAKIIGWDFSYIEGKFNSDEDSLPWNYEAVIKRYMRDNHRILDIDTGGGEFLLSLEHPYHLTSATEGYPPNVELCRNKLGSLGIDFHEMSDYSKMPFADSGFDVVINRHGSYDANEIYRILKPNGLFVTQQVGEDNDHELVEMLLPDCEKSFSGHNLKSQIELFEKAGFTILEQGEAYRPITFYDTAALVWFAKIIEWEFVDFSVDRCFAKLLEVEKEIAKNGFVCGNIHRFYFVAKK
ncbi:MAG: class I SAM-dependent methyltransferase [Ruminococcus sp.]|nr:class I SAM-dependent methyltransferase [Ruminococcus sp.]